MLGHLISLGALLAAIAAIVFWVYKLVSFDWEQYEEDPDDDFLKPYDDK